MPLRISLLQQFEQQQAETRDLRFSCDGKRLASVDGTSLYLWKLQESGRWEYERSLPWSLAAWPTFSRDGKRLAFRGHKKYLQLLPLEGEEEEVTLPYRVRANAAFSPDHRWLVMEEENHQLIFWDLFTSQPTVIPLDFGEYAVNKQTGQRRKTIEQIRFTPDGQRLVLGAADAEGHGSVDLYYFDPIHKQLRLQATLPHGGIDVAIAPNGKLLATIDVQSVPGPFQQVICVYDLESCQLLHIFRQRDESFHTLLAFSPDSRTLLSGKSDGLVDLFSVDLFALSASFAAHPDLFTSAMDPIGGGDWAQTGYIATGGASVFEHDRGKVDCTIKIWKVEGV